MVGANFLRANSRKSVIKVQDSSLYLANLLGNFVKVNVDDVETMKIIRVNKSFHVENPDLKVFEVAKIRVRNAKNNLKIAPETKVVRFFSRVVEKENDLVHDKNRSKNSEVEIGFSKIFIVEKLEI